jgi:hypothetical protein
VWFDPAWLVVVFQTVGQVQAALTEAAAESAQTAAAWNAVWNATATATATATMKFWTNGRAASLNSFYHGRIPFHKTLNEWCLVPPTYWNLW